MHGTNAEAVTELIKLLAPLIASYLAYRRATKALYKARAVEAACTFPTCGHVCAPLNILPFVDGK